MYMRPLVLPLLFLPGAAVADVTPQDVWDNMMAGYGAFGFQYDATLDQTGDTLIANDGVVSVTYPVIGGQMAINMPPMTLTALGDGTVQISMPATYIVTVNADIPEEIEPITVEVTIAQEGLNSIASGDPGDVTYTTSASGLDMLINNMTVPDNSFDVFDMQFEGEGYDSVSRITVAEAVTITNNVDNASSVTTINIDVDGFKQETVSRTGKVATTFAAEMPGNTDIMNLAPALRSGLSIVGTTQTEGGTSETKSFDGDTVLSTQNQTSGPSTASFGLDQSGIRFEGIAGAGQFTMDGAEMGLPFPIEMAFGAITGKFAFPLLASEDAQDFAYGFSVKDLAVADDIWNLIDAGQGLDRSPVNLALDLTGELTNSLDLVDPATWEQINNGVVPVAPVSIAINDLSLGALGAAAMASGAFTFDNDDLATFGGIPRPEGKASAQATGLNAAIDQLIATGLVPEQEMMVPRMFMGMFAVAQGDDELTTELEINGEGHVILNGQRIQ